MLTQHVLPDVFTHPPGMCEAYAYVHNHATETLDALILYAWRHFYLSNDELALGRAAAG